MNGHDVIWTQPPALSANATARVLATPRQALHTPAILRFDNDSFMQDFMNLLATSPERLADYKVRRETWRGFVTTPVPEAPKTPSLVRQRLGILGRRSSAGAATATAVLESVPSGTPLKLYQPAQLRHYLIVSSLVCQVAGLPDRTVDPGRGEKTGYVIRRLLPPAIGDEGSIESWDEYAWVAGPQGSVWRQVGVDPLQLVDGEERLPMFAVQFAEGDRRKRRLLAGVIPVGKREAYLGAPKSAGSTTPGVTSRTSRKVLLRKEVIEPWKTLVRRSNQIHRSFVPPFVGEDRQPTDPEKAARLKIEREQIQTVSWFVLLDFAKYLAAHVKPVWRAVLQPSLRASLPGPDQDLFDALEDITLSDTLRETLRRSAEVNSTGGDELYDLADVAASLREALAKFGSAPEGLNTNLEQQLEDLDIPYDRYADSRASWPDFLFPLADPDRPDLAPLPPLTTLGSLTSEEEGELTLDEDPAADDPLERLDELAVLVLRALRDDDTEPSPQPAVPTAAIAPADALIGWFVIRCVYERPACEPLHGEVMSEPTEPFQMAGFFDPDAPARPVRIGLPIDTTPAGLRKFDKNTAFVISDVLCGQIQRLKGITLADLVLSVLPWPFHKDLPSLDGGDGPCKTAGNDSLGMICSLSIPIVTICALVLLIIMVTVFDYVFRWMPYFIFCFPLPGLKAKKK